MSSIIVGQSYDLLLKMVIIGDSGVGKTNLLSRFQRNQFSCQSKPTIGVEFATKTISLQNYKIKCQIWDTAGQQRFRAITHAYYKGASGALIVFDLSRRSTFDNISKWLKELKENAQQNIVSILIGNKSDLIQNRGVKLEEIQKFTQQHNLAYLQTSAKQNSNVGEAFHQVISEIYNNQIKQKIHKTQKTPKQSISKNLVKNEGGSGGRIQLKKPVKQQSGKIGPQKKKCCE